MPPLTDPQLDAWRSLYSAFWRISASIESDLAEADLPSLSWYDALYQLYLAPERRLRMSELAQAALLSRSGLTRLVDRLEKDGLIVRRSCSQDGRGQHAELTPKGVEMLRKIWVVYRRGIEKRFAEPLSDAEMRQLSSIFGKLAAALREPD